MPTQSQLTDILFKKALGVGTTSSGRKFFEEPLLSRSFVTQTQIWAESDRIPSTAPGSSSGVLEYVQNYTITAVAGATNSFTGAKLVDAVPFNWGDKTSYLYTIKDSLNNTIGFGDYDWTIDTDAGILMFNSGQPTNVPLTITFYRYTGLKGTTGVGGYVTTGQTGQFVGTGQSGQFVYTGSTGQFVTTGQTGQFVYTGNTGNFRVNPVTGLTVTGVTVTGLVTVLGAGHTAVTLTGQTIYIATQTGNIDADKLDGQHGSYYLNLANLTGNSGTFLNIAGTGTLVYTGATGQFVYTGNTGQFVVTGNTGQFVTTGQTGQFVYTGNTGNFRVNPVTGLTVTGVTVTGLVTILGAGQTAVTLTGQTIYVATQTGTIDADKLDGQHGAYYRDLANLTGNSGTFLNIAGTGTLVYTGNTGNFRVNPVTGIQVTGATSTGLIIITGVGGTSVTMTGQTVYISGGGGVGGGTTGVTGLAASGQAAVTGYVELYGGTGIIVTQTSSPNRFHVDLTGPNSYLFVSGIQSGVLEQFIKLPVNLGANPVVLASLRSTGIQEVVPYQLTGVVDTGFWISFATAVPSSGYDIAVVAATTALTGTISTLVVQSNAAVENVVYTTGVQSVGGEKTFYEPVTMMSGGTGYGSGGQLSIDVTNRKLFLSTEVNRATIDWDNMVLQDGTNDPSVQWGYGARKLVGPANTDMLDWTNGYLKINTAVVLDWNNKTGYGNWSFEGLNVSGAPVIASGQTGQFVYTGNTGTLVYTGATGKFVDTGSAQTINGLKTFSGGATFYGVTTLSGTNFAGRITQTGPLNGNYYIDIPSGELGTYAGAQLKWTEHALYGLWSGDGLQVSGQNVLTGNQSAIVWTSRDLTAGSGLQGGGNLSADRTFHVGTGYGISVTADNVAIDTSVVIHTGNTGQFVGTGQSGQFVYTGNTGTLVYTGNTGILVYTGNTGNFRVNPITGLTVTGVTVTGLVTLLGVNQTTVTMTGQTIYVSTLTGTIDADKLDGQHSGYYLDLANFTGNSGTFLSKAGTGTLVYTGNTGTLVYTGNTGSFITTGQTGQFVYTGNTGNFITTSQTGTFAYSGNAMGVIVHGSSTGLSRPAGYLVITWIGSVNPSGAIDNDIWIDTA